MKISLPHVRPCRAILDKDHHTIYLQIELADDRSVMLVYSDDGCPPRVSLWSGTCDWEFGEDSFEAFEDWARIAVGAMSPDRERQFLCSVCKERPGFGPMLHDEIWSAIKIVPDRGYSEMMCPGCMQRRAMANLGRRLEARDLRDCPFNAKWLHALGSEG